MKIAQLTSNFHKVSPISTQALYSHAAWLVNGLVAKGNDVTLFGSGDSETTGKLFSVSDRAVADAPDEYRRNYLHLLISHCFKHAQEFDLVHSHFTLLWDPLESTCRHASLSIL